MPPILRPGDLSEFGMVKVMVLDQASNRTAGVDFLSGWDKSRTTAFAIVAPDGKTNALVYSLDYQYSTADSAKAAVLAAKEPGLASIQKKGADALSDAALASLNSHPVTWNAWQGLDHDNLWTSVLFIQSGAYVNLIEVNSLTSAAEFSQKLIENAAIKVSRGNVGTDLPTNATSTKAQ